MFNTASLQGIEQHSLDVSEVTAADLEGDPQSGPHFQSGQHLNHPLLCSHKGPDLVGLKFTDDETFQHPIVESFCISRRQLKPPGNSAPSHPLDSRHR